MGGSRTPSVYEALRDGTPSAHHCPSFRNCARRFSDAGAFFRWYEGV